MNNGSNGPLFVPSFIDNYTVHNLKNAIKQHDIWNTITFRNL